MMFLSSFIPLPHSVLTLAYLDDSTCSLALGFLLGLPMDGSGERLEE